MEKLGTCRKFAGYPKDNGTKFLREFESFCKLHELDILNEKTVAAFHLHLEGPALTWFNGLSPDLSWTTVKRLFTDKYVHIGWQHPSVVIESETFHNMQLGPTQEIEDFSCQIQEKGHILAKPEHEIMFCFITGLPEKLAFYIFQKNYIMSYIHCCNRDIELSESNIMSWRQHVIRCLNQDRGHTTLLDELKPGEVLIIYNGLGHEVFALILQGKTIKVVWIEGTEFACVCLHLQRQ
ncbi:unnamed protein product [Mytilus coruscus]|uniref:Retrotransposon gag domain-containing protein n=1 Tax=Mytilus coruscus TaxID=42192 RepID=A0A6J8B8Z2_MYTCO|nr:unnamed protein product [Mytilus coruscus]